MNILGVPLAERAVCLLLEGRQRCGMCCLSSTVKANTLREGDTHAARRGHSEYSFARSILLLL
jgi:hypothetical protein